MPISRRALGRLVASAATLTLLAGCNRAADSARTETTAVIGGPTTPTDSAIRSVVSGWDESAGPVLLVASERRDVGIIILPHVQGEQAAVDIEFETAAFHGIPVVLVNRAGRVGSATLGARATPGEDEECSGWPMLRVVTSLRSIPLWTIGLVRPQLVPLPLDSIEALSPGDSATLVAEVIRLAAAVPINAAAAGLSGLPFAVEDLRRFRVSRDIDAIIAYVVRRIHQEANPLEERTLLIAEWEQRDRHSMGQSMVPHYVLAFHQRTAGREETLEGGEVLAALTERDGMRPKLILARESERGVRYVLLERLPSGKWRTQWTSALVRC